MLQFLRSMASLLAMTVITAAVPAYAADPIKIGVLKVVSYGPFYIATERGYFAAEGFAPELIFFDASPSVPVAVVSGSIDFGAAGLSAGLYNLASQGALQIIAGAASDAPGFTTTPLVASKRAYDGGLRSFADLAGKSVGISAVGSASHYALALAARKGGLDIKALRVLPLQSGSNVLAAVVGGQADAGMLPGSQAIAAIERGDVRLLGYASEASAWQIGVLFTSSNNANNRRDMVERFLRAFRKATKDYNEAFVGPDGRHLDGPTAPAIRAIISKYTGQSMESLKNDNTYVDAEGRLDIKDVMRQIEWYKSQKFVRDDVDGNKFIDKRYVIALP